MFKQSMIADAQVMDHSKLARMYMKFNKEQLADDLIHVKMFTSDSRAPELIDYVKTHNPNKRNLDMAVDLKSTKLNGG